MNQDYPCKSCIIDPVCKNICEKFFSYFDSINNISEDLSYFERKDIYKTDLRAERFNNWCEINYERTSLFKLYSRSSM